MDLRGREALWTMTHVEIPGLADYAGRISLYFDDEIVELVFPAPYLNHHPTRLVRRSSRGDRLDATLIRPGFGEAFVRELEGFWEAVTGRAPKLSTTGGTSDARFIKDYCPVVEFGLVGQTMHMVDERVVVADLETLTVIYETFIERWFGDARS